ncbi:hypothetical protein AV530_019834 [Patagioenas fasciata monilis]|uniref:Uncharacterized protein n=1 Tax=Patagioenas fasciata monilis TaxID=372326 RepID=A0A1V4JTQ1_PATFA|nr:hypothetical protein AV530_019834 [Patagioenas fasciata monilis]
MRAGKPAGHLPRRAAEASQQLQGSPFHGLFLRSSKASRPLVSYTKPSFALAAFLHLATSGASKLQCRWIMTAGELCCICKSPSYIKGTSEQSRCAD